MDSSNALQSGPLSVTQEAAVLFSAGFPAAAEEALRAHIDADQRPPHEAFAALLEILHFAGRLEAFDHVAARYVAEFPSRPAPRWGFPEEVSAGGTFAFEGTLDRADLERLLAYARDRNAVGVDMSRLARIEFAFVPAFGEVLATLRGRGKRVILANIAELHAALLEAFDIGRHVALLRRWRSDSIGRLAA